MTDDKFDSFLSDSLKAAEIKITTPINEVEQMIAEKIALNRQKKKQKQRRLIQIAAAVILLLSISAALFFPESVYALKKQLFQTIHNVGKSINISLNSDAEQLELQNQIAIELAAIQGDIPFKILIPQYIPPEYTLESIKQSPGDKQAKIIMTFSNNKSTILFTQTNVSDNYSVSVNVDVQEAQAEKIALDKYEGNIISYQDGSASLIWITNNNVMCQILGDVSPDQAMEIANSIQ
jgi:predicted nucleic acid-binding Zn ribbon protein